MEKHPQRLIQYTSRNDLQKLMGLMLAAASTGALVITLQDLVSGLTATILATGSGLALQVCLYLFARHHNHRVRWFAHGLLGLSVLVTAWYMEATWQQHQSEQLTRQQQLAGDRFLVKQQQQQLNQLNQLNQQIEILLANAEQDTGNQYRARGLNTLDNLEDLYQRRDALLANLQQQNQGTATELNGQPLFVQNDTLRLSLFLVLALMIDLAAIIALQPEPVSRESRPSLPEPAESSTDPEPSILEVIMERIRNGDYGEYVPVKQIVESEPIRHPELKSGLEQLLDEGVISKVGNRYRHLGVERQGELY
ncbi:hypothetical protein [Endozoicomonas sp. SCSIO W0465]|uniref:hypothetical protein n=1 Tax=Endozoicomonas sp. SCSIO W0465 TaxID=2918516 RepID=UPI002075DE0A|nr:hypothetical protein [Endozoicomonas sp. SCSIO W0465]USE39153.1 hypothetical protein MJO57_13935 [Endozoicomonas sp. SCSIO W0465]